MNVIIWGITNVISVRCNSQRGVMIYQARDKTIDGIHNISKHGIISCWFVNGNLSLTAHTLSNVCEDKTRVFYQKSDTVPPTYICYRESAEPDIPRNP